MVVKFGKFSEGPGSVLGLLLCHGGTFKALSCSKRELIITTPVTTNRREGSSSYGNGSAGAGSIFSREEKCNLAVN